MPALILKRASASRPSGEWSDDYFDVLADGVVVGRVFKAEAAPAGMPWMWTMLFDYRWPTHGYAASREAAMAAFAKSWRREYSVMGPLMSTVPRSSRRRAHASVRG
jgi:hypothetical protein